LLLSWLVLHPFLVATSDPEKRICYGAINLSRTQDTLEHLVEMLPCLVFGFVTNSFQPIKELLRLTL
jgi:hypothetical protein